MASCLLIFKNDALCHNSLLRGDHLLQTIKMNNYAMILSDIGKNMMQILISNGIDCMAKNGEINE
jgi:predicted Fe-Mo cluster-binding NifX family protein